MEERELSCGGILSRYDEDDYGKNDRRERVKEE
jgi:hypothetical protein